MPGSVPNPAAIKAATQAHRVEALRTFLIHRGYDMLPRQGSHMGYLMKSALANWHSGANKRDPQAWDQRILKSRVRHNANNDPSLSRGKKGNMDVPDPALNHPGGIDTPYGKHQPHAADKPHGPAGGPHPGPTHKTPPNSPQGHPHPGGGGGAANFGAMLAQLLGHAAANHMMPLSLADQVASPDTALAQTLSDQVAQLPSAKKHALQNVSDWYGQVQGAEGKAASRDQAMAKAGAGSMEDAAKGIMASLGGRRMAGSGEIGAMGANDANTLSAIGASDKMLASDLGPIFDLVKADASNKTQQQFREGGLQLNDQLGQAKGQADADRASAIMQILQANSASRQTNFQNKAGLLNTLASLQISGINAQSEAQSRAIMNALHVSEIKKNAQSQGQQGGLESMSPQQRADFVQKIVGGLVDPNTHKLVGGMDWPAALRNARNYARSAGLNPHSRQVASSIIGPALAQAGITGQGGGYWPAIFQP